MIRTVQKAFELRGIKNILAGLCTQCFVERLLFPRVMLVNTDKISGLHKSCFQANAMECLWTLARTTV